MKLLFFCLVTLGLFPLEPAGAEFASEAIDVRALVRSSPASSHQFETRGDLSSRVLERARNLSNHARLEDLEDWRELAGYPYAYPELRDLARHTVQALERRDVAVARLEQTLLKAEREKQFKFTTAHTIFDDIEILRLAPEKQVCGLLVRALDAADDLLLSREILWALAKRDCAEAPSVVLDVYREDAHPELRLAAALALVHAPRYHPEVVRVLEARGQNVGDLPEARAIAQALANQCRLALDQAAVL